MAEDAGTPDPIGKWSMSEGLEEILMKSSRLMARRGFHGTSMRDLAQETGRSLAGLYHYFRSKEDLLFLINIHGFTTLNNAWETLQVGFDRPREKLYAFVYLHVSYFSSHVNEMRVMMWGTQALHLEKARTVQKLKDRHTDVARQIIHSLREEENNREIDDAQVSRETYLLFGMMNWMPSWYTPREHGTAGQLIDDIYRTFLSGISRAEHDEDDLIRLRENLRELHDENKAATMWGSLAKRKSS